jgi:hypothetical protein
MTVTRTADAVVLDAVCDVEDAEFLLQHIQAGVTFIEWSGCTHLHTACLQVIMAARLPMRGVPANSALARWLAPLLLHHETDGRPCGSSAPLTACRAEA